MGVGFVVLLHTAIYLEGAVANSTTAAASDDGVTNISKAFISLSVLGAAFLIAFVVAKLVDYCYDRAALRDDASDMSEHTRQLIKARIALSRFKRPIKKPKKKNKNSEKDSKKNAKAFLNLWSKNAKKRKSNPRTDIIINVEEARSGEQLQVNGTKKSPHVTFIDEVNSSDQDGHGTVLSIAVPKLKPKQTGNAEIPSISAKVAEKENGMVPTKDNSFTKTSQKEPPKATSRSDRASSAKDSSGKVSNSGKGRATPPGETTTTSVSGRTTPVMPRPGTGNAAAGRTTPVMPRIGTGSGVRSTPIMPRAGTANGSSKNKVAAAQSRPKTAPSPKPGHKVVSVKSALVKTPSTPKLNVKPAQTKK